MSSSSSVLHRSDLVSDINYERYPQARIFETHGVEFSGTRGEEFYGSCPFSDKPDKFYVNRKTWLWDSKSAGMSGNIAKFLAEVADGYEEGFTEDERTRLSKHRKLPPSAFSPWQVGFDGLHFTVPVRDIQGHVVDVRMYEVKRKMMRSTAGCKVGLLGVHKFKDELSAPIYICEGEWDAMAMQWLLKINKRAGLVVAVPGAGIFKRDWAKWFSGRRVYALYDHDEPGKKGAQTLSQRITGVAKDIVYAHWPTELPNGFDVRDWIVYGIRKNTLDKCLDRLHGLFKKKPPRTGNTQKTEGGQTIRLIGKAEVSRERPEVVPTLKDVHGIYQKWLHLPNTDAIDVMLAAAVSQKMDGLPIWIFLVGPPGGAKTITMEGLAGYQSTYATSSLTAHALISGANFQGQQDPSLIPRLNGKVLVIKDFTTVLNLREDMKEEIFGILRDAYDGRCGKIFGNGVERAYESRFTIIAAVTPKIYEIGARHAALGERFLKYVMGDNLDHHEEDKIISKAIDNVDHDKQMKEELMGVTAPFLEFGFDEMVAPKLDMDLHKRIIRLAQFGARLRGTVSRDTYNNEIMTGKPFAEVGSRLGIQLAKLARSLAVVRGKTTVTEKEYRLVRKVMLDTVSQRCEDIVRCLYQHQTTMKQQQGHLTAADIATQTRYPMTTVRRVIEDLHLLNVIARTGGSGSGYKHSWSLSDYMMSAIADSKVYAEERTAPRLVWRRPG